MNESNAHISQIGILIAEASRLMRRDFNRRARDLGLSSAQWAVLSCLAREEGLSQVALADSLDLQPISLARHIDRLEARGCVVRRPDPNDRRVHRLFLTDEAHPLLQELRTLGQQTRNHALNGLSTEQQEALYEALTRIRHNLSQCGGESQETPQ